MDVDSELWVAWEPPPWVDARGPSRLLESAHFAVRWGSTGVSSTRAETAAPDLLLWLEQCWTAFCDPASPTFFVTPYTTAHWSDDGLRRKMNVYIADTGLDPHPNCGGWAHQGTWTEADVAAVRHAASNPQGKLHHSYLALAPGAAEAERTVCHEFGHCLQMHTGGHLDAETVGYQWEAHAEYCVQLRRPYDPGWAPHVPIFLRTAHLPVDSTNYDGDDEGGGRQYIVWPLYAFLDKVLHRSSMACHDLPWPSTSLSLTYRGFPLQGVRCSDGTLAVARRPRAAAAIGPLTRLALQSAAGLASAPELAADAGPPRRVPRLHHARIPSTAC